MIFAKSAPASPAVILATSTKSTSPPTVTPLIWTARISFLPSKSGLSTNTCLSNLPGLKRAGSNTSGLFVAARTITGASSVANPSISANNWFKVCSLSSLPPIGPPLALDLPIASISSIKIIAGATFLACSNKSLTLDAPTPTNISINAEPDTDKNSTSASPATALASKVLPVPGGPTKRTPLGIWAPSFTYLSGFLKNSTTSWTSSLASLFPAISSNLTFGFSELIIFLDDPIPRRPPPPPPIDFDILFAINIQIPTKMKIGKTHPNKISAKIFSSLIPP